MTFWQSWKNMRREGHSVFKGRHHCKELSAQGAYGSQCRGARLIAAISVVGLNHYSRTACASADIFSIYRKGIICAGSTGFVFRLSYKLQLSCSNKQVKILTLLLWSGSHDGCESADGHHFLERLSIKCCPCGFSSSQILLGLVPGHPYHSTCKGTASIMQVRFLPK